MVVPHSSGNLVRSLVRVPGSGTDRNADPSLLDLSNVSPLAATVPVPRSMPRALSRPKQETPPALSGESGKAAALSEAPTNNKPVGVKTKKRQLEGDTLTSKAKVAKTNNSSPMQTPMQLQNITINNSSQVGKVVLLSSAQAQGHPAVQEGQVAALALPLTQTQQVVLVGSIQNVKIMTAKSATVYEVKEGTTALSECLSSSSTGNLIQEVSQLKKENQELAERLKKFQDLFRNKESLRYVASRILQVK